MPTEVEEAAEVSESKRRGRRSAWAEGVWHWFVHHAVRPVPWIKLVRIAASVLLTTVLWYLLKLSREYSVEISYPLEVTSPPTGYMLSGQSERRVKMRVRGNGYTLVRYRTFNNDSPLQVNLQELGVEGSGDSVSHRCISRAELERVLSPQIPTDLTLEHFATEQLCYDLSRMDRRRLPVKASVRYTLRNQFAQFQPAQLSQDSVIAVGPAAELAHMDYASTDTVELGEIGESQRLRLTLSKRGEVQFLPSEVAYTILVSQYTQKRLVIPIRVEKPEQLGNVTLLPGAVELTCDLPIGSYARVKADDFTLRVRFYGSITPERLLVELVTKPADARNVSFSPQYVSYLIAK